MAPDVPEDLQTRLDRNEGAGQASSNPGHKKQRAGHSAYDGTEPVQGQTSSAVFSAATQLDDDEGTHPDDDVYESAHGTADEAEDSVVTPDVKRSGSTLGVDEEFQGPDTSSLAAFLLSLVNLTPKKQRTPISLSGSSSYEDFESEYGDSEEDGVEGEGSATARDRARKGEEEGWAEDEREQGPAGQGRTGRRGDIEELPSGLVVGSGGRVDGSDVSWPPARDEAEGLTTFPRELVGPLGGARKWLMARLGMGTAAEPASSYREPVSGCEEAEPSHRGKEGSGREQEASSRGGSSGGSRRPGTRFRLGESLGSCAEASETERSPTKAASSRRAAHPQTSSPTDTAEAGVAHAPPGGHTSAAVPRPSSPPRLPALSEESVLLTDDIRHAILAHLPAISQGREWVLLYSTAKHGISLHTLYRKAATLTGPCLVAVRDRSGCVFGGYSSSTLQVSSKRKYQGTSDSFMFSDVSGAPEVFRASGANRYFVLCLNDSLAFGGGGHFALRLEQDLLSGSTGECETYASPKLAQTEDFTVSHVELWGFAHTSKYAPSSATWHEPVSPRSFHSVL